MNIKRLITLVLIVFVGASLVYLAVNEGGTTPEADTEMAMESLEQPSQQVIAYYFHGFKRCKTCLHIESEALKAIETAFPEELKENRLVWKAVNFEEEANADMADKYELVASSLVIVEFQDGQETQWKTLEKVWELVWNEEPFAAYVREEVENFLISDGDDG